MKSKTTLGVGLVLVGTLLAAGDYIVTHGSTPPGSFGTAITDLDDLNGTLAGVAPAIGLGTLLAFGGVLVLTIL